MSWEFLYLVRRLYRSADDWGRLYLRTRQESWECLSYTYELPWKEDSHGKSLSRKSRINEGSYSLRVRTDGPKGWRLELMETGHRRNIQVHRAHKSLYIEGCILPVHFEDFIDPGDPAHKLKKGQLVIQERSIKLMAQIRSRYEALHETHPGHPRITISAMLPAAIGTHTAVA